MYEREYAPNFSSQVPEYDQFPHQSAGQARQAHQFNQASGQNKTNQGSSNYPGQSNTRDRRLVQWVLKKKDYTDQWMEVKATKQYLSSEHLQYELDRMSRDNPSVQRNLNTLRTNARTRVNYLVQQENEVLWKQNPTLEWRIAGLQLHEQKNVKVGLLGPHKNILVQIDIILEAESRPGLRSQVSPQKNDASARSGSANFTGPNQSNKSQFSPNVAQNQGSGGMNGRSDFDYDQDPGMQSFAQQPGPRNNQKAGPEQGMNQQFNQQFNQSQSRMPGQPPNQPKGSMNHGDHPPPPPPPPPQMNAKGPQPMHDQIPPPPPPPSGPTGNRPMSMNPPTGPKAQPMPNQGHPQGGFHPGAPHPGMKQEPMRVSMESIHPSVLKTQKAKPRAPPGGFPSDDDSDESYLNDLDSDVSHGSGVYIGNRARTSHPHKVNPRDQSASRLAQTLKGILSPHSSQHDMIPPQLKQQGTKKANGNSPKTSSGSLQPETHIHIHAAKSNSSRGRSESRSRSRPRSRSDSSSNEKPRRSHRNREHDYEHKYERRGERHTNRGRHDRDSRRDRSLRRDSDGHRRHSRTYEKGDVYSAPYMSRGSSSSSYDSSYGGSSPTSSAGNTVFSAPIHSSHGHRNSGSYVGMPPNLPHSSRAQRRNSMRVPDPHAFQHDPRPIIHQQHGPDPSQFSRQQVPNPITTPYHEQQFYSPQASEASYPTQQVPPTPHYNAQGAGPNPYAHTKYSMNMPRAHTFAAAQPEMAYAPQRQQRPSRDSMDSDGIAEAVEILKIRNVLDKAKNQNMPPLQRAHTMDQKQSRAYTSDEDEWYARPAPQRRTSDEYDYPGDRFAFRGRRVV